jgi:N-acetylglucosamine-6-phosphate deacetylase
MMIVTDAMASAAGGPNCFRLQDRLVTLQDGRLQLADGTLAGSNLTMDGAVRYCINRLGVPLDAALRMASTVPAMFLKRDHDLGRIAPGHQASLVHLAGDLTVQETWIDGQ